MKVEGRGEGMEEGMIESRRRGETKGGRESLEGDMETPWEGK
jgi:hypothetical protein